MRSKIFTMRLSDRLLKKIDEAAKENYQTRSQYIRESIVFRLNNQHVVKNKDPEDELQALIDQAMSEQSMNQ